MMDDYKRDLDRIHAPEALIESTLQAIADGQQPVDPPHTVSAPPGILSFRRRRRRWTAGILAGAAALFLALSANRDRYTITALSQGALVRTADTAELTEVSVDEYSDYLGVDCTDLIRGGTYLSGSCRISEEQGAITDDLGTFFYQVEDTEVMILLSKTQSPAPSFLSDLPASRVAAKSVTLARSGTQDPCSYYASGEADQIRYYLYSHRTEETTFKKIVKKFMTP